MQENKFKGVSQYTGEMVYGQLIRGENNFSIFTEFKRLDDAKMVPIIKGTQCQSTGIFDVDGVEIYDNDIVETNFKGIKHSSIVYSSATHSPFKKKPRSPFCINVRPCGELCIWDFSGDIKVVGNVFSQEKDFSF